MGPDQDRHGLRSIVANRQQFFGFFPWLACMSTVRTHSTDNPSKVDYWKSLLRIEADMAVTLAHQKLPVERILQFVPGVMIQFDKPCDRPLSLEIDGNAIAEGEVVKVGDKFGLRITEVLNRDERWIPLVQGPKSK